MAKTEIPSVDFRVATYNAAYFDRPKTGAPGDYKVLFAEADVVGFQEAGRPIDREQIALAAKAMGFGVFTSPDEKGTPIAWRLSEFELLDSGAVFLTPRTFVGAEGAGPNTMGEKHHVWVRLRHKPSGRIYNIGNDHLTPSIYLPKRRRLHDTQTDKIRTWIASRTNQVITVGDYNIDAQKDAKTRDPDMPFVKFGKVNVRSSYYELGYPQLGTHGDRHIDYVWYRVDHTRFKPTTQTVLTGLSSDHRALVVRFKSYLTFRKRAARRLRALTSR